MNLPKSFEIIYKKTTFGHSVQFISVAIALLTSSGTVCPYIHIYNICVSYSITTVDNK